MTVSMRLQGRGETGGEKGAGTGEDTIRLFDGYSHAPSEWVGAHRHCTCITRGRSNEDPKFPSHTTPPFLDSRHTPTYPQRRGQASRHPPPPPHFCPYTQVSFHKLHESTEYPGPQLYPNQVPMCPTPSTRRVVAPLHLRGLCTLGLGGVRLASLGEGVVQRLQLLGKQGPPAAQSARALVSRFRSI